MTTLWKMLIFSVLITGCSNIMPDVDSRVQQRNYNIITIENCEYIEFDEGTGNMRVYSLTHKGNCSNPIHQYAK